MVLSALRGACGFLTRIPIGGDAADWRAFTASPWTLPVIGTVIGLVFTLPVVVGQSVGAPLLGSVAMLGCWVGLLGITHLDGAADLADAAVVHGDVDDRVVALKDSAVGVGGVAALVIGLVGTALAVASLATAAASSLQIVAVVVGAEVGAKTAMAVVACGFDARHEGLGSQLTDWNGPGDLLPVGLVVVAVVLTLGAPAPRLLPAVLVACLGAVMVGVYVATRANSLLSGVNGDVFGAVDVAARLGGLVVGAALVVLGGVA
ncbi:MAG: adenosylcobinamide-GDP ribazoletransferase [Halolamina sp.]